MTETQIITGASTIAYDLIADYFRLATVPQRSMAWRRGRKISADGLIRSRTCREKGQNYVTH